MQREGLCSEVPLCNGRACALGDPSVRETQCSRGLCTLGTACVRGCLCSEREGLGPGGPVSGYQKGKIEAVIRKEAPPFAAPGCVNKTGLVTIMG